ncbi:heterokaryon incompatibility [Pestalotiopsis sp. NC0098]|nr:heterokaryon incompatibility [Pestalotiopsis sp. NC0098]
MSLQNPRPFIALSYAWGDKYDTNEIELNRYVFSVTSSLHGALRAVRESYKDVLVWADAVSINQNDPDERSEQVQRMYLVYHKADMVGIWLGPEADDSSRAILLIEKLNEDGLSQEDVKRIINSSSWERHFHALVDLFERDYWDRLWVV